MPKNIVNHATKQLIGMFVNENLPLSLIESPYFIRFINTLEPNFLFLNELDK